MKSPGYKWDVADWDYGCVRDGHFIVHRPDYPGHYTNGQAKRAHVVYWLNTGIIPEKGEDIHHVNENPLDDRFENLKLMPHAEHARETNTKPKIPLTCTYCGKEYFLPQWRINRKEKIGTLEYFCSMTCRAQHKWNKGIMEAMINGRKKTDEVRREKSDVLLKCDHCGKEYHIPIWTMQARIKSGNHGGYCSLPCKYAHGVNDKTKEALSIALSKAYAEGRR
jgi:RNase P subunit RPR2